MLRPNGYGPDELWKESRRQGEATLPNGVYPPSKFAGGHFGGTGAWSQRMNCNERQPNTNQNGSWDTVGSKPLFL